MSGDVREKSSEESDKLRKHLTLLREEYVKLQNKYCDIEKRYNVLLASRGVVDDGNNFVVRLLATVANLFDKELYSDLSIKLNGTTIKAHKFVLSSRSDNWGVTCLADVDHLDFSDIANDVGINIIKWVYTDSIDFDSKDEEFILDVMRVAKRFVLNSLVELCEKCLMSFVDVSNCVKFYQTADEIGAETLKNHCSELVSNHWDDFTSNDFVHMSASLLYSMFKAKTDFPLHTAIKVKREDVLFLYLMEYDSQLIIKLNETDKHGELPLDLALRSKQKDIAKTLVSHKANVNAIDSKGNTLLHSAINREDEFAATFLILNHASVDIASSLRETPLHLCADRVQCDGMSRVAKLLVQHGADANLQDVNGNTALHRSVISSNKSVFAVLLEHQKISLDLRNARQETSLAIALNNLNEDTFFADELVKRGSSLEAINSENGDSLLHINARKSNETAGLFLVSNGTKVNLANNKGETPLHIAAAKGLKSLVSALLEKGANCNLVTTLPTSEDEVFNQTPLHLAISGHFESVIDVILSHHERASKKGDIGSALLMPNLNVKNSRDQTPLHLALQIGMHSVAQMLINGGASVNIANSYGLTLLHQAIIDGDSDGAKFLLDHGADINIKTPDGEPSLLLAVKHQLDKVVKELCAKGANVNIVDNDKNSILWTALKMGNEDIASILVQYNCDTNFWRITSDCFSQTLLHCALDENDESAACFLIRCGCDINCPIRPEEGYIQSDLEGQTPLHMACNWGLNNVVQTLLEHLVEVNTQDLEGKTALMTSIIGQQTNIINQLLNYKDIDLSCRDNTGNTAFSLCIKFKNNKAALAILNKEPNSAEKFDGKGRNYLHIAIEKGDIEGVLFLLSIQVNIQSRLRDNTHRTPLHIAAESGSEMIVRNLLLAGANINDLTGLKQTALHMAAERDHSMICSILIENGIIYDAVDINQNNALHIACQKGNLQTCKVLLTESRIEANAVNGRQQNPIHVLASYGRENAAAIFDVFIECMPEYPINKLDADGNSPLLLAYINGNGNLCRALVKAGSCLGTCNNDGFNIFNHHVATKNLLYRLLDFLPEEPPWTINDSCLECGVKFGLTNRKHHCRHCGRILCSKCSGKDLPILKFNLTKPVRVCEICFDVLTLGFNA